MKTISEVLNAAADVLERGWCQGGNARDADGNVVSTYDATAVAFCAYGALCAVGAAGRFDVYQAIDKGFVERLGHLPSGFVEWNDDPERTKEEVIELFRRAAELSQR